MAMDARPGPGFPATLHLERPACAPFHEERRMKLTEATMFHRKSGGGPAAKREPSPEGLGLNSEHDLSAVGAALNLGPLAPVSLGAQPKDLQCPRFPIEAESWAGPSGGRLHS